MHLATIDCGTTNSRVYIVNERGEVKARAVRKVGVRDTALSGSTEKLKTGLREAYAEALAGAGLSVGAISLVVSSGMITSEIGLAELPHLWAPASLDALAGGITRLPQDDLFPGGPPVYFVRGVKNWYDEARSGLDDADRLDFMRGEETQVVGYLSLHETRLPLTFVVLSSHTKFISINREGAIAGSLTTVSGQVYEALMKETFLAKSVEGDPRRSKQGGDLDEGHYRSILDLARRFCDEGGFLRALLVTRFMDTLLSTTREERQVYVEAVLAAEDLKVLSRLPAMGFPAEAGFVLVGSPARVRLYELLLEMSGVVGPIRSVTDTTEVDSLSIAGSLLLLRRAGILRE